MAKVIKIGTVSKKEDKNIQFFLDFYPQPSFGEVHFEAIPEDSYGKSPDFYVPEIKALVEVKELHDRGMVEELAQWSRIATNLEHAVENHPDYQKVRGEYLINTPDIFKFPSSESRLENAADSIVRAVLAGVKSVIVFDILFEITKIGEKNNRILFSSKGHVREIEAGKTVYENIYRKLRTANAQLAFKTSKEVEKKILLLVNLYDHADDPKDVVEGLSFSFQDLLSYESIDELWLQTPKGNGMPEHDLLYTGKFLRQFVEGKIEPTRVNAGLYQLWFNPLEKLGEENKDKLYQTLKNFLANNKPDEVFDDLSSREQMMRLGIWLAEKERFEDAIWLIDKFIDDPDPPEPTGNKEADFFYHAQIEKGEDPLIITSTLGQLAWVVQRLALRKEHILKALDYTARLLVHRNLYVKQQAMVPLIEIAARRQWLDGWGKRPREGQYLKFHDLVFELVELVAKNSNYVAIADWLVRIFSFYKDLSTKEVEFVLDTLKISDEAAPLFIYFGIYRERHFKIQGIDFDSEPIQNRLRQLILDQNRSTFDLRERIAWNFWKILEDNKNEFEVLRPYIELLLLQPYQPNLYSHLERVINDWLEEQPDVCVQWYKVFLHRVHQFMNAGKGQSAHASVWLYSTEEIVEAIAAKSPENLLEVVEGLVGLLLKRVPLLNVKRLFESFNLVPDEKLKTKIRPKFQELFDKVKEAYPNLETVELN